jgi:hypothetical protein
VSGYADGDGAEQQAITALTGAIAEALRQRGPAGLADLADLAAQAGWAAFHQALQAG